MARTTGLEPATPGPEIAADGPQKGDSEAESESTVRSTVRSGSLAGQSSTPEARDLLDVADPGHKPFRDSDLARLAARWPALPVEVRRALLVLAGIPQEPAS